MGYLYHEKKVKKSESQESWLGWQGGKKNQKESLLWKNRKIQKNTDGQTKSWEKSCYFDDAQCNGIHILYITLFLVCL